MTTGVNTRQIEDRAVTGGKLGVGSSKGDIIVYNGTTHARREVGADGTALLADSGTPSGVKWGSVGVWQLVETQTVSSAVSSVDFATGIDNTGDEYALTIENLTSDTDAVTPELRLSNDGGSTYESGSSAYEWAMDGRASGGAAISPESGVGGSSEVSLIVPNGGSNSLGNASGEGLSGEARIIQPSDTAQFTRLHWRAIYERPNGDMIGVDGWGDRRAAEANDALRLFLSSGNIDGGKITLYRRKAA